jgi:prepilin-type N-terminal cleavage/methylation domain-containing protein
MIRFQHRFNRSGSTNPQRGFSLIELAIVVGVTGLLFGGLWRLMASGNSQLREQTAADQMNQLVGATRNFLASSQGQSILTGLGPNLTRALTIPAGPGCALPLDQNTFCNFLPAGFTTATTNSYGQGYTIIAVKDGNIAGAPAQTYNFLILTTGGDVIPDSSGGRLAANIGANGFIFSNATCSTAAAVGTTACGAFGSFTLDLAATGPYGAAGAASGHIATQNSSTLSATTNSQWLARVAIAGDAAVPPLFNTMTVPLFMQTGGAAALNINGNQIWMNNSTAANGGGTINLQEGSIIGTGNINISNNAANTTTLNVTNNSTGVAANPAAWFHGQTPCSLIGAAPGACQPAVQISGSMNISDSLTVNGDGQFNQLSAVTFIYTSDMRVKKNIIPLTNSLDRINQLHGYSFNWKKDNQSDIGLVAQDVQKIYPELVHATADGKLGVEYGNLVAPMIEAIKELRQQNIALQKRIDTQERLLQKMQQP